MTEYSVGEAARASGVTVRTLHHYDQIGLLVPAGRTPSGYRLYSEADLTRLHHIRTYQALGFSLDQVTELLAGADMDALAHLRAQRELIEGQLESLAAVRRVIDTMLEALMDDVRLTAAEIFDVFGDEDPTAFSEEARERWGDTDSYAESRRRTGTYDADAWRVIRAEQEQIEADFAALLADGVPPSAREAHEVAERHRLHIDQRYYECTHEMHCGLADMYLADPRFTEHYDGREPGLAAYVHDAIWANAVRSADAL